MGVDVDPAGGDEHSFRVDLTLAGSDVIADCDDAVAVDRDIAAEFGCAGAIDDASVADGDVVHVVRVCSHAVRRRGGRAEPMRAV